VFHILVHLPPERLTQVQAKRHVPFELTLRVVVFLQPQVLFGFIQGHPLFLPLQQLAHERAGEPGVLLPSRITEAYLPFQNVFDCVLDVN